MWNWNIFSHWTLSNKALFYTRKKIGFLWLWIRLCECKCSPNLKQRMEYRFWSDMPNRFWSLSGISREHAEHKWKCKGIPEPHKTDPWMETGSTREEGARRSESGPARIIHNSKLEISRVPLCQWFLLGSSGNWQRQNCPCKRAYRHTTNQTNEGTLTSIISHLKPASHTTHVTAVIG